MSDEWIKWEPNGEVIHPEELDTLVYVKFSDGNDDTHNNIPEKVSFWMQGYTNQWVEDNAYEVNSRITHYKVAK